MSDFHRIFKLRFIVIAHFIGNIYRVIAIFCAGRRRKHNRAVFFAVADIFGGCIALVVISVKRKLKRLIIIFIFIRVSFYSLEGKHFIGIICAAAVASVKSDAVLFIGISGNFSTHIRVHIGLVAYFFRNIVIIEDFALIIICNPAALGRCFKIKPRKKPCVIDKQRAAFVRLVPE